MTARRQLSRWGVYELLNGIENVGHCQETILIHGTLFRWKAARISLMPTPHTRDWIDYALAVAPFLAMLVAIGVALVQVHLQREKMRQDLYDKRFAVYWAIVEFDRALIGNDDATSYENVTTLHTLTAHTGFLFGTDVVDFVAQVHHKLNHIFDLELKQRRFIEDKEGEFVSMSKISSLKFELFSFIEVNCGLRFAPYLRLQHRDGWMLRLKATVDQWMDRTQAIMDLRYPAPQPRPRNPPNTGQHDQN
jgi:hypothetical protein